MEETVHEKRNFPLRISSVIVTKYARVTITEEIFNRKLLLLCSKRSSLEKKRLRIILNYNTFFY